MDLASLGCEFPTGVEVIERIDLTTKELVDQPTEPAVEQTAGPSAEQPFEEPAEQPTNDSLADLRLINLDQ